MSIYLDKAKELFSRVTIPADDEDTAFLGALVAGVIAMAEALADDGSTVFPRESLADETKRRVWYEFATGSLDETEALKRIRVIDENLGRPRIEFDHTQGLNKKFDLGPVCDIETPSGPCVLVKDHPIGEGVPGYYGHMSGKMLAGIKIEVPDIKDVPVTDSRVDDLDEGKVEYASVERPPSIPVVTGTADDGSSYKTPVGVADDQAPKFPL